MSLVHQAALILPCDTKFVPLVAASHTTAEEFVAAVVAAVESQPEWQNRSLRFVLWVDQTPSRRPPPTKRHGWCGADPKCLQDFLLPRARLVFAKQQPQTA